MIPPALVRIAPSCMKGLTGPSYLAANKVCTISHIHTDNTCRHRAFRKPREHHITCQSRCISLSSPCCTDRKYDSYFEEFYTAVKRDMETVSRDETLRKMKDKETDPGGKQRAANKWIFMQVLDIYIVKNQVHRKGHCQFIEEALKRMKDMGLEREMDCYKALFKAFPQDEMVVKTYLMELMAHFPKQQTLAMEIMDQMAQAGVIPDNEFARCVALVFGTRSPTFRKVRRMLYWMPKFKHMNPYKLPHFLPGDEIELALLALKKMAVDMHNVNTVWKITDESVGKKDTFAASAQSEEQQQLLQKHPVDVPLYVEGGFTVWLRDKALTYFILKAEVTDPAKFHEPTTEEQWEEDGNVDEIETMFDSEESGAALVPAQSQHHQLDGTIFAMCITGTSTKESLIAWIRHLQEKNPTLEKTPIVFTLRTPEDDGLITAENYDVAEQAQQ